MATGRQGEQAEHGQVETGAEHRAEDAGLSQRHGDVMVHGEGVARDVGVGVDEVAVHQRGTDEVRDERHDLTDHEHDHREDDRLGDEDRVAPRDRE
jgi:hypothetical protein